MQQLALFDYAALDAETRIVVQQRTSEIQSLMRRSAQDIVDIGLKLIEVKERLGHGNFGGWLEHEFGWTDRTARRFIGVASRFKTDNLSDLLIAPSALYLLASNSVPDEVRESVLKRAENGESITYSMAKAEVNGSVQASPKLPEPPAQATTQQPVSQNRNSGFEVTAYSRQYESPEPEAPSDTGFFHSIVEKEPDQEPEPELSHADSGDLDWPEPEVEPESKPEPESKLSSGQHYKNIATSAKSDEHYTPRDIINATMHCFDGCIDLDPCSNSHCNPNIPAHKHYTIEDNGLELDWQGSIYLNPPYSESDDWTEKLLAEYESGNVDAAIVLVKSDNRVGWFAKLMDNCTAICLYRGYIKFSEAGAAAPWGSTLFYFGPEVDRFYQAFSGLGWVCQELNPDLFGE